MSGEFHPLTGRRGRHYHAGSGRAALRPAALTAPNRMTDTAADVYSPDVYVDGPPHEAFTRLRREQPVCWQDVPGQAGYWAVLRHADVVHVARHPELFSASEGGVVIEDLEPASLESDVCLV